MFKDKPEVLQWEGMGIVEVVVVAEEDREVTEETASIKYSVNNLFVI